MIHGMIDFECFALIPAAEPISLGFKIFDPLGDVLKDDLPGREWLFAPGDRYRDPETVRWWEGQGETARAVLDACEHAGRPIREVLEEFIQMAQEHKVDILWANSPNFDMMLLEDLFRHVGMENPFKFYNYRDVRTVHNMFGIPRDKLKYGTPHKALDDCIQQCLWVQAAYKELTGLRGFYVNRNSSNSSGVVTREKPGFSRGVAAGGPARSV